MGQHNLNVLAAEHDVQYLHPLLEEVFLSSWVRRHSVLGYPTRTHAMQALFGSLLPGEVLARTTKASFNRPYFHHYCRAFAEQWSGEGVDSNLVDVDELKKVWSQESPHAQSLPLLHQAWLADSARLR
jgi:asparagine synthase (glutamine-hydrolysing)